MIIQKLWTKPKIVAIAMKSAEAGKFSTNDGVHTHRS